MEQMLSTDTEVPDRIDRDEWAAAWEILEPEWPNSKQIPFPTVNSQTSEWKRVASLAPDHLLWLVKRFMFPGELLQTLDDTIIETWMSGSRRDCVEDGLQRFREQPLDRPTQLWIDQWVLKTQHRPDHSVLAPLMDNADDWRLLRAPPFQTQSSLAVCASI
ncbi:hypothetical protein CCR75_005378 [Bremia lactucae]|uniref:Uncharacterized protein n=1 Tax=Bremia lactucae TaxID=4779 RepID=A0A976IBH8_BRELC|nr:hypothetical protein CCR75_005378 [Bremia lactucae]